MTELLTLFTCLYICKLDHKVIKYDLTMINVLIEINHQYSTTHMLNILYIRLRFNTTRPEILIYIVYINTRKIKERNI